MVYTNEDKRKQYSKQYNEANKEKLKAKRKLYYQANRERFLANVKQYNQTYREQRQAYQTQYRKANRAKLSKQSADWRKANPARCNAYRRAFRKRHASDPMYRLHNNIRLSIRNTLNRKGSNKSKQTHEYLGCSFDWFVNEYWPSKIKEWNIQYPEYPLTVNECVIDHIKPLAQHDDDEVKVAWHYTNLQPLPAYVNNIKRDTWGWEDECHWRCNILYNQQYMDPYLPIDVNIA
tara:strand:+ start:1526 stop:2227 length:702 start_codon:yes stop_codon:yes gene_type:complete